MSDETINHVFNTAWEVVNNTGRNVFLTGKAGTGKTTFLKKLMKETSKNCVVVAPTGVAAINAGGVTMHSFFQLPFNAYLRHGGYVQGEVQFTNKSELLRGLRITKAKRELMSEMDLLIIDEVSMVRADLLDAVDDILRSVRGNRNKPFGGVQVLFIGDLFQLPPVVQDQEKELLKKYYESPFFFNAEVLKENPPLIIELKKIYRQTEEKFIGLLNSVRNNSMAEQDFELLHSRYVPSFWIDVENIITLTTHNNTADKINRDELQKLNAPIFKFEANVDGDFSDRAYPTEKVLELKLGAQIMFIKNDTKAGKYYNGKLAKIIKLTAEEIIVKLADSDIELRVEKEKWDNIKYVFDKEDNKINEEPLGSFLQYPIRLAWAITIHKSQGLTFTKMAIDAGASFAAGQVYVALSRCTSLTGLTLLTKIPASAISTDQRIVEFIKKETDLKTLNLDEEKFEYSISRLEKIFDWNLVNVLIDEAIEFTSGKEFDGRDSVIERLNIIKAKTSEQTLIAMKFMDRVNQIVIVKPIDTALLEERVKKAKPYFIEKLLEEIIQPIVAIREEIKIKKRAKTLLLYFNELILDLWRKVKEIEKADVSGLDLKVVIEYKEQPVIPKPAETNSEAASEPKIEKEKAYNVEEIRKTKANAFRPWSREEDEKLMALVGNNKPLYEIAKTLERTNRAIELRVEKIKLEGIKDPKEKIDSKKVSLDLYKEKKTIEEIATLRGMAASTIEGHLALFIKTGEVNLFDFISEEQFQMIKVAVEKMGFENLTDLKKTTGDSISWGQLRMVVNYLRKDV